jgi:hypothetical protein
MQTVAIEGTNYPIVKFNARITNKSLTLKAVMMENSGFVGVGEDFKVYNMKSGEPIIKPRFKSFAEAVRFAKWFISVYNKYLAIWESDPNANLPLWCRYTVKDGLRFHKMCENLNKLIEVSDKDISRAWNE